MALSLQRPLVCNPKNSSTILRLGRALKGRDFNRAENASRKDWGLQPPSARRSADTEGAGGFNPPEQPTKPPPGFSRSAISPESPAFPLSRLDNAGRETPSASAAAVTVNPAGSTISVRIKSPEWEGSSSLRH